MRNYLVLTGFLIGVSVGVILVGQQIVVAYGNAIHAELEAKLLALEVGQAQALRAQTADLILTGDIMLSRAVGGKMSQANDFSFPFLKVAEELKKADLVFGNLEGPISSGGKNQGSQYSFRADPLVAGGLVYAGYNVLSVANNHMLDYGLVALKDTLNILKENNIMPVGAGENSAVANELYVKEINNNKIGFLAYTNLYPKSFEAGKSSAGISSFNLTKVSEKIRQAKASSTADIILVSMHWGEEYAVVPNSAQEKLARQLVDAGADVVVGHHPHVVQNMEEYKNGLIFYSLGNFIFDQSFSAETMSGYLVKIKAVSGKIKEWEVLETKINTDFQVEITRSIGSGQK